MYHVPALDEDFWETVGRRMRRPPSHCQCQYQKFVSIPHSLTEVKTLDAHVEKGIITLSFVYPLVLLYPTGITAQPGTIKRRRQIRALLDDNGYFDDGADATPLREKLREAARVIMPYWLNHKPSLHLYAQSLLSFATYSEAYLLFCVSCLVLLLLFFIDAY